MAGIKFSFKSIIPLLSLSIGLAKRADENRAENFTILYCNFENFSPEIIGASLEQVLRGSDAIISYENHYFFLLLNTDKYGATTVKEMFEDFFASYIESALASYPIDGESALELLQDIQNSVSKSFSNDLLFLDEERLSEM
jgi:hypothetical protein